MVELGDPKEFASSVLHALRSDVDSICHRERTCSQFADAVDSIIRSPALFDALSVCIEAFTSRLAEVLASCEASVPSQIAPHEHNFNIVHIALVQDEMAEWAYASRFVPLPTRAEPAHAQQVRIVCEHLRRTVPGCRFDDRNAAAVTFSSNLAPHVFTLFCHKLDVGPSAIVLQEKLDGALFGETSTAKLCYYLAGYLSVRVRKRSEKALGREVREGDASGVWRAFGCHLGRDNPEKIQAAVRDGIPPSLCTFVVTRRDGAPAEMATFALYLLVSLFERNWIRNISPTTLRQPGGVGLVRRLHTALCGDCVFAAAFDGVVREALLTSSREAEQRDVSQASLVAMRNFVLRVLTRVRGRDVVRSIAGRRTGATHDAASVSLRGRVAMAGALASSGEQAAAESAAESAARTGATTEDREEAMLTLEDVDTILAAIDIAEADG